jgi:flagellar protein FlbD
VIMLTRLDGTRFAINDEQIERIEETGTTVIRVVNGNRYPVQESLEEVVERIADFRAAVLSRADRLGTDRSRKVSLTRHLSVLETARLDDPDRED